MRPMTFEERNRETVFRAVSQATAKRKAKGISAVDVAQKTGLCLRTVQTHLRHLRLNYRVSNYRGIWSTPPTF